MHSRFPHPRRISEPYSMVKVTHVSAVANTEPGMLKSAGGMIIKGFTLHKIMYMVRRLRSRSPVDSISIKTQKTHNECHAHARELAIIPCQGG
ncbi:hypothetical protein VNO77_08389 [Canavalia gladiata]|uniref:Uncharacterized protein n=1 Tax=Canavalia gladiata TaxID=3824 RepID=A0AAN9MF44_CANGL